MTLSAFLTVAAIHLMAVISPGPAFVVSVRTAASEGFGAAAALAVGFGVGAALWSVAALAGLALLFSVLPGALIALKVVGGLFLLWIALQIWRHAPAPLPQGATVTPRSAAGAFRLGLLTFVTNPKAAVFFGAVFVGLVPPGTPLPWLAAIVAVTFANETLWYVLVARVFSRPRARALYGRAKTAIDRSFSGLIALFGVKIALG